MAKKQARKKSFITVFLLFDGERVAVRKRDAGGLLGGLWEFPNEEGAITLGGVAEWLQNHNLKASNIVKSLDKTHIFTHIEWAMSSYFVCCEMNNDEFTWITVPELEQTIALPTAFRKFLPSFKKILRGKTI